MILSHKHRFIFIKTKKTAGTSVEIALSQFCGEDDIITPITPRDEEIRKALGYRGPQNYRLPQGTFFNHMPAREIKNLIGSEIWDAYFKFCFERNPWDKVISWYFWEHRTEPRPSLGEFIKSGRAALVGGPGGIDLYTIDKRVAVDRVCLYENIEHEMEYVAHVLNLGGVPLLPKAKSEFRKDRRHYSEFYNEHDRNEIARLFGREISSLGYSFEEKPARECSTVDGTAANAPGEGTAKDLLEKIFQDADELNQKGETAKAVETLASGLSLAPDNPALYYVMTATLLDAKCFTEGLEAIGSLPLAWENEVKALVLKAYCLEGLAKYTEAGEIVEVALHREPGNALALNLKGILAYKNGDRATAESFFRKAIEADNRYGEPYTDLGILRWASGQHEEGLELLERGFSLSPLGTDIVTAYHTAITAAGAFSRAEKVFREAHAKYPHNRRISFLLIDVLLHMENYRSAMAEIEQAMMLFGIDDGILSAALDVRKRIDPQDIDTKKTAKKVVSLCMIVRNEEEHLGKCLMSVKPVIDEMIVVDTGSSDRTRDIAAAFGAKVFDVPWTGDFSEARNISLAKASGTWILVLDADEIISSRDHVAFMRLIDHADQRVSYSFVTRNYLPHIHTTGWTANDGTYPEEAGVGWFGSTKVRLFPRNQHVRFSNPVHELVEPSLEKAGIGIRECSIPVHHYGKLDQEKINAKWVEYYLLGRKKLEEKGETADALRELAIQAGELKRFEEALELWQRAVRLDPLMHIAYINMSSVYLQMDEFILALRAAEKALHINPNSKEALCNYAVCELYAGDAERAITALAGLLKKDPRYPPANIILAIAFFCSGKGEEGKTVLTRLGIPAPAYAECISPFATKMMAAGRNAYARVLFDAAENSSHAHGSNMPEYWEERRKYSFHTMKDTGTACVFSDRNERAV